MPNDTTADLDRSYYSHADHRGIWVPYWVLRMVGDDYAAAVYLSQVLWWHQPGLNGAAKVRFERDGKLWLVRHDEAWEEETTLTVRQVRRVRKNLVDRELLEYRRFKVGGLPMPAVRPVSAAIAAATEAFNPDSGVTPTRQSHGSDANASVPSDAGTSVPSSLKTNNKKELNLASTDPVDERARSVVASWWEHTNPRPQANYLGVVGVVKKLLREDVEGWRIVRALNRAPCPTYNALKVALANDRARSAGIDEDREGPSGRIVL